MKVLVTGSTGLVGTVLVSELAKPTPGLRPPPGLGKGFITVVSDEDDHLKDFEEYMP